MALLTQRGYAVTLISDKDAHALRGIIEVMRRTNQDRHAHARTHTSTSTAE